MIIHAHLEPDHPAVLAYRKIQANRARLVPFKKVKALPAPATPVLAPVVTTTFVAPRVYTGLRMAVSKHEVRHVCKMVMEAYGIEELIGADRKKCKPAARYHACAILAIRNPYASYAQIGRVMELDHSTVMYAIKTYNTKFGQNVRGLGSCACKKIQQFFVEIEGYGS